jgi:hypothetical protein
MSIIRSKRLDLYQVLSTKYQVSRALPVAGRLCENEKLKKKYLARQAAKPQRPPAGKKSRG